jgi:glycine/D-amino acid oxidase-like deaminating enzyme
MPKGSVEDCLLYDTAEEHKYVRLIACDDKDDYLVAGGRDHAVGQEEPTGRFEELETWTRERFTQGGKVDYAWSGQITEPIDYMAFIGKNFTGAAEREKPSESGFARGMPNNLLTVNVHQKTAVVPTALPSAILPVPTPAH